jgi:GTPase SAR1 family protein
MTFRFLILGDRGVGKTSFIERHKTGEFIKKDSEFLNFETTSGQERETLSVCIEEVSSLDSDPIEVQKIFGIPNVLEESL